jgi:PKD repeat protein
VYPGIRYTGRLASDPLGQMTLGEGTIVNGSGVQTTTNSRWGDYTDMTVDPVDDCTFWYSTEYLKSSGTFNWSTWITSFKLPSCTAAAPPPPPAQAAPTGLSAAAGDGHVALTWSAAPGATSYSVYRGSSASTSRLTSALAGTSYDDTSASNGTTYTYTVTATGAGGESAPSASVTATPHAAPVPPVASFSVTGCTAATCSFDATASTGATSWSWTYGDGRSGTGKTSSHTYSNAGAYTITLTASATTGSSTATHSVSCTGKRNRVTCTPV